jgi:hypothetical protein
MDFDQAHERFERVPDLIGTFIVLLVENLDPDSPMRGRLWQRHRASLTILADNIRRGQRAGRYRTDLDPNVKALEIVAFINGMETSWLLDPSIPLAAVFKGYAASLAQQLALPSSTRVP